MQKRYSIPLGVTLGAAATLPANAGELTVKVQLPEFTTGQYVRPYLAVWLEKADGTFVQTLALWHEVKDKRGNPLTNGDKYLKIMRNWWGKSGATPDMKFDGISSATRPSGEYELVFTEGKAPLNTLPPGKYQLMLEVAREVKAGRTAAPNAKPEDLDQNGRPKKVDVDEPQAPISFEWPAKQITTIESHGKVEMGKYSLVVKP